MNEKRGQYYSLGLIPVKSKKVTAVEEGTAVTESGT